MSDTRANSNGIFVFMKQRLVKKRKDFLKSTALRLGYYNTDEHSNCLFLISTGLLLLSHKVSINCLHFIGTAQG